MVLNPNNKSKRQDLFIIWLLVLIYYYFFLEIPKNREYQLNLWTTTIAKGPYYATVTLLMFSHSNMCCWAVNELPRNYFFRLRPFLEIMC